MLNDTELTGMVDAISHTQAALYYKSEEVNQPVVVVRSVFMLIVAVVSIQLTRAGVSEEDLNDMGWLPDAIAAQMKLVGWNLEAIKPYFNMD